MSTHDISTLTDAELMRYSRQILLDDWNIDAQIRLKNSTIAIIGMGGLGSIIAPILVRAGVGVVHLFDFDNVDDSNLQRQLLYTQDNIGQAKALCAQQALKAHNPWTIIHAHHIHLDKYNIQDALTPLSLDLLIDGCDNFGLRTLTNKISLTLNIPLLSLSAIAEVGQLALFEPHITGCYACLFNTPIHTPNSCANSGVLASTVSVMGALGADAALKFLGKGINPIANQLIIWQGTQMTMQKIQFAQKHDCICCL